LKPDTTSKPIKLLRLLMPQWQGGGNHLYTLGAELLAWLAPASTAPLVEVPLSPLGMTEDGPDNGVVRRSALMRQFQSARSLIAAYQPDKVVTFGGDCFVALSPFSYLIEKYGDALGILWIDAHPDVGTPADFSNAHTMVLGTLLGYGDPEFASLIEPKIALDRVMLAGLKQTREPYNRFVREHKMRVATPDELAISSQSVLDWIRDSKITRLAIHFDLDVLSPTAFRAQSFAKPGAERSTPFYGGDMGMRDVTRLIQDASAATEVVGIVISEHLPWDADSLRSMLQAIPILQI
jgi:arginase